MAQGAFQTLRWLLIVAFVMAMAILVGVGGLHLLGVDQRPGLPLAARIVGALTVIAGLGLAVWTFAYHPPARMARVTAKTIEIALRRLPPEETAVETLITTGPYRYVRNPTYLAFLLLFIGCALAIPLLGLLVSAAIMLLWWNLVVIPPEERELNARFGDDYARYRAGTGRFVPRLR